jgi:hypothetical protein
MAPLLTLVRPDESSRSAVGDDGLTEGQRIECAENYRTTAARPMSEAERESVRAWLASRAR